MKPVPTANSNAVYGKPGDSRIPVVRDGLKTDSYWQPSLWERIKLFFGFKVKITQENYTQPMPKTNVTVTKVERRHV